MKKPMILATFALTTALALGAVAGCSGQPAKEDVNANIPAGAPPLMPASHADRFQDLGANGCYGCHGANDKANPMLKGAVALPADHYADGSVETQAVDPTHEQCITCHAQS